MLLYHLLMVSYFVRATVLNLYPIPLLETLLCYNRREPYLFVLTNIAFTLAYIEVFVARIWFYKTFRWSEMPKFLHLVDQANASAHKLLLFLTKFLGSGIVVSVAYLMVNIVLYHWHENTSGLYLNYLCQVFWLITYLYYVRQHVYDMIVLYATAMAACFAIEDRINNLKVSLQSFGDFHFILHRYKQAVVSLNETRKFVSMLNFANNLVVLPFIGIVISQLTLEVETIEFEIIRLVTILAGSLYAIRGFIFTAYCSRLHVKSSKLHFNLSDTLARNNSRIFIHVICNKILEDLSCKRSHLIYRDMTGEITLLEVLKNIWTVIQFSILVTKFRNQIYEREKWCQMVTMILMKVIFIDKSLNKLSLTPFSF